MAILTEDIKLLKSAVMADVPEGGGAMTGIPVIDGQSNNLFPDTSAMDRAFGRVNIRKLFGVAHTDDTDTLMGAHAIVTQAPADPLVHCTLMRTPGWADTRAVAQDGIEKYLVKGPRLVFRLWDTHYSGSLIVKLICMVAGTPPAGGDAIVLRNPNGQEQYVRILRVSTARQQVAVVEGNGTVLVDATVATCEIGNPLEHDFLGPPALRVGLNEAAFAQVFSTNIAGGARFYGIKALAAAVVPGDFEALVAGGIYTPVVPAATVESPIIDVYPLKDRTGIVPTAQAPLTLDNFTATLAAGTVLTTPTPISPGTLSLVARSNTFTDLGGELRLGTLAIGTVDYKGGIITFASTSPNYGSAICTLTYRPATVAPMANHSASFKVTSANQGRAYVNAFEPPPAPGTFTLSYMAQERWYDLKDSGFGKLAGGEGYGSGSVDSVTGSMAVTLGAVPDVGSVLIADWGDKASANAVDPDRLPLKLSAWLPLPDRVSLPITLTWSNAGNPYTAVMGTSGFLTGDATGNMSSYGVVFEPRVFPDGPVTVEGIRYESHVTETTAPVVNTTPYVYQADASVLPIGRGTFRGVLAITGPTQALFPLPATLSVYDRGGLLFVRYSDNNINANAEASEVQVGDIDYATGRIHILDAVYIRMWFSYEAILYETAWTRYGYSGNQFQHTSFAIAPFNALTAPSYSMGTTTTNVTTYETVSTQTPVVDTATASKWTASIRTGGVPLLMSNMAFKLGGEVYTVSGGVLRKGWNPVTATPLVPSAGTLNSDGVLTINTLPDNFQNGIVWSNAVQDVSAKLVGGGVFRTASAPLKTGVMQLQDGYRIANANESGDLSGDGFYGNVDFQRGVVMWSSPNQTIPADSLSYNAVFLQYLPLDKALLGIDTVRLPLDGKVPIFRTGDLVVVHNTLSTQLPNPLVKGTAYPLGRERIASVRIKDALGVVVPSSLYVSALNPGTITFPAESSLTGYSQPFTVEHRIEDMMLCAAADISGQLKFTRSLTHDFPAGASFVSSALAFGDLFARTYNYVEQATWTGAWSDGLIGSAPAAANFNEGQYPVTVTNRGAITERWALIFTSGTAFRIVGESVGDIGTGNTGNDCAPINPATGAAYFTLPALGWGNGWSAGNLLRFNTAACGTPFWVVRTVLQGPATLDSDVFSIAFRGDVDRP